MSDLFDKLKGMPDELRGYTLRALPKHLEAAGMFARLHALLGERVCDEQRFYERPPARGRLRRLFPPRRREVARIRCENLWYGTQEREGNTAGFIADVARAWRLAESAAADEVEASRAGDSVALEVRYALMSSSVNNIGANVPPALLSRLVETGLWTAAQGLTYAGQIPDLTRRAEALTAVAASTAGEVRELALVRALDAALAMRDEGSRSAALVSLSPSLPQHLLRRAAAAAEVVSSDVYRVRALTGVGRYLDEPLKSEVLSKAREGVESLKAGREKDEALLDLLPHLPESEVRETLERVMDEAASSPDAYWHGDLLQAAAPHLSEPQWSRALGVARGLSQEPGRTDVILALAVRAAELGRGDEALGLIKEAMATPGGGGRSAAVALAKVTPHLEKERMRRAVAVMRELYAKEDRAEAIAGMAPHLPEDLFGRALSEAKAMRHEEHLGAALSGLLPRLPDAEGQELLNRVVNGAIEKSMPRHALNELASKLAIHLPASLLRSVTAEITKLDDAVHLLKTVAAVAETLPSARKTEAVQLALDYAGAIASEEGRAEAFASLAPLLAETRGGEEALAVVRKIGPPGWHAKALTVVLPHLPAARRDAVLVETLTRWDRELDAISEAALPSAVSQLAPLFDALLFLRALEIARRKRWETCRAGMLAALAYHAASLRMLEQVVNAAAPIRDERTRSTFLTAVAEQLARLGSQAEALATARSLPNYWERLSAFEKLAPHLSEPHLRQVLALTEEFSFEGSRWSGYAATAWRFAELGDLETALQVMLSAEGYRQRALAAARIVPYAPARRGDLIKHAMAIVKNTQKELGGSEDRWQGEVLSRLAPHLAGEALAEAFTMALEITDPNERFGPLSNLSLRLAESHPGTARLLWMHALHRSAARSRAELLSDLRALSPLIEKLGGHEVGHEIISHIMDVGQCWPA